MLKWNRAFQHLTDADAFPSDLCHIPNNLMRHPVTQTNLSFLKFPYIFVKLNCVNVSPGESLKPSPHPNPTFVRKRGKTKLPELSLFQAHIHLISHLTFTLYHHLSLSLWIKFNLKLFQPKKKKLKPGNWGTNYDTKVFPFVMSHP